MFRDGLWEHDKESRCWLSRLTLIPGLWDVLDKQDPWGHHLANYRILRICWLCLGARYHSTLSEVLRSPCLDGSERFWQQNSIRQMDLMLQLVCVSQAWNEYEIFRNRFSRFDFCTVKISLLAAYCILFSGQVKRLHSHVHTLQYNIPD